MTVIIIESGGEEKNLILSLMKNVVSEHLIVRSESCIKVNNSLILVKEVLCSLGIIEIKAFAVNLIFIIETGFFNICKYKKLSS